MLGGIAFQLRKYLYHPLLLLLLFLLKFFIILFLHQSLLSYTHSALENFSYDTCGSDPSVL